jgi:hypothetical protein
MATSDQARGPRTWRLVAAGAGCALALAGCGSSGAAGSAGPAGGAPSAAANASAAASASAAAAAACPHLTSLRASLTNLAGLQVSPASAGQLSADLTNIERQLSSLKSLASPVGARDAAQLTGSLRKITLAAQAEIGEPTPARLAALESALTGMKDAAQPMIRQLKVACPSAS